MHILMNTAGRRGPADGYAMRKTKPSGFGMKFACAVLGVCLLGSSPAFAGDPCKSALCLFGKLKGSSGGSECSDAEKDYFNILKKKHGKIKWDPTSDARGDYLNSCKEADPVYNKMINNKFGKVMG